MVLAIGNRTLAMEKTAKTGEVSLVSGKIQLN